MKYLSILFAFLSIGCSSPQKEGTQNEDSNQTKVVSPAGANSEEATFFTTQDGHTGLSWLEKKEKDASLKFSVLNSNEWTEPKTLISSWNVLTNWADFPGIQTNGQHWVAWYLQLNNPDTFAYDVMVMQSSDEGKTWSSPQRLHSDSTLTEHGFVSAVNAKNGFQLMWLDGRLASEDSPIFTVRSAHLSFEGDISNRVILDENTCTCCQTTMLNTGNDNFIALYRDRTEEEIRDIAGVNFNNEGALVEPQIIFADDWHIPGCPVNGPRSIMNGDELGVVWFTMGKEGVATIQFVTSTDDGKTYSQPLLIDENNKGRVDILAHKGAYYISYMDDAEEGAELKIVKVEGGKVISNSVVVKLASSRKTGFPRMALSAAQDGIFVSYTDVETKKVVMDFMGI